MEHNPLAGRRLRDSAGARFGLLVALLAVLPGALAGSWLAVVVGLALALLIVVHHRRSVLAPVAQIERAIERQRQGDEEARAYVAGGLVRIADGVNFLLDDGSELARLRAEQAGTRERAERLLRQMSSVAGGNLALEADVGDGDFAPLANTFNAVVRELRSVVESVNATTRDVGSASTDIAAASTALKTVSDRQARQTSDTAAAVDEMTLSIQQISENARQSSSVASEARKGGRRGAEAVEESIRVMERVNREIDDASKIVARLGESSQEIGAIVQFIAQIARQTNTLALNASIQAARAGEHGRGFAVVADEVRTLAERSSNATRQINAIVTSIQVETADAVVAMDNSAREVSAGVRITHEAGDAIRNVNVVVDQLGELIDAISIAAESQAQAAIDISRSMHYISEDSQSARDGSEKASESVLSLADLAERLRHSVVNFTSGRQPDAAWAGDGDD